MATKRQFLELKEKLRILIIELRKTNKEFFLEIKPVIESISSTHPETDVLEIANNLEKSSYVLLVSLVSLSRFIEKLKDLNPNSDRAIAKEVYNEQAKSTKLYNLFVFDLDSHLFPILLDIKHYKFNKRLLEEIYPIILQYRNRLNNLNIRLFRRVVSLIKADYLLADHRANSSLQDIDPTKLKIKDKINTTKLFIEAIYRPGTHDWKSNQALDYFFKVYGLKFKGREEEIKSILNNKKEGEIERDMCQILMNTTLQILHNSPELLRSSRVNIYITLSKFEWGNKAHYNSSNSNFSNLIFNFSLNEAYLLTYFSYLLFDTPLVFGNSDNVYYAILHELTHSFDLISNKINKEYEVSEKLLGKTPMPATVGLMELFIDLRLEGLAVMNGSFNNILSSSKKWFMFTFARGIAKELGSIEEAIIERIRCSRYLGEFEMNMPEEEYRAAFFINSIILFSRIKPRVILINDSGNLWPSEQDHLITLDEIIKQKIGTKEIELSRLHRYIGKEVVTKIRDSVNIHEIDPEIKTEKAICFCFEQYQFDRIKKEIQKIAILSIEKYYEEYKKSCRRLKLDPGNLTIDYIKDLNKQEEDKFIVESESLGFECYID